MLKELEGIAVGDTVEIDGDGFNCAGSPAGMNINISLDPNSVLYHTDLDKGIRGLVSKIYKHPTSSNIKHSIFIIFLGGDKYTLWFYGGILKVESSMPQSVKASTVKKAPKGFVTGFNGSYIESKNAIKIGRQWYEAGKSAVSIGGNWTINNPDLIDKDRITGEYIYKYMLSKVVVDYLDSFYQWGYVKKNDNIITGIEGESTEDQHEVKLANISVAMKCGFKECMNSGYFFKGFNSPYDKIQGPVFFKNIQSKTESLQSNIRYGLVSPTYILSENKKYSFGVEIETSSGVLRPHVYKNRLNLDCMRDGSISGGEYVTGILQGDCGFNQLKKICYELSTRCEVDNKCGLHVHIGGVVFNKEFTVFAYILGMKLEKDLMKILPKSRRNNRFCQKLPKLLSTSELPCLETSKDKYHVLIDDAWSKIFEYITKYKPSKNHNKKKEHPGGRYCSGVNSEDNARYKWLNFVPCNTVRKESARSSYDIPRSDDTDTIATPRPATVDSVHLSRYRHFMMNSILEPEPALITRSSIRKEPSYTIEFRCHSATTNYIKIRNWVLITMAFVNYVENNKKSILSNSAIKLEDIVKSAFGKYDSKGNYLESKSLRSENLIVYINKRKSLFSGSDEISTEACEYEQEIPKYSVEEGMKSLIELEEV